MLRNLLILLIAMLCINSYAETFSCEQFQGYRFDKYANKSTYTQSTDKISMTKTIINIENTKAKLILIPTRTPKDKIDKLILDMAEGEYQGIVSTKTENMLSIIVPENGKTEIYTIYPELGLGILSYTRSMYDFVGKSSKNPEASAVVLFANCESLNKY